MRHVRFANQETGWAVLDAAAGDGTPIALVGPLVHLEPGERARVCLRLVGQQENLQAEPLGGRQESVRHPIGRLRRDKTEPHMSST